jgi:hypothetical protein
MDLGRKSEFGATVSSDSKPEPKVHYPSITLNDKAAEDFCKEHECEIGQEYAGTVKFKVTGKRDDSEIGKGVTLDILEIGDVAEEHTEGDEKSKEADKARDDESDKAEEKVLGFKPKKRQAVKPSSDFMDNA